MRRALTLLLALAFLVPLLTAAAPAADRSGETLRLRGLRHPVRVVRDPEGIPHIQARSRHDLHFAQGWLHAQDRLFQMDLTRRQASGTLAELLGQAALPGDVQLRTLGLRRAAQRSLDAVSDEARAVLRAYSAGVNRWVAEHDLPQEYADLGVTRFEPWTPLDTSAVNKILTFSLSFDLGDLSRTQVLAAYQQAGAAEGFDGVALFSEDLFRSQPFDPASTVPDATAPADAAAAALAAPAAAAAAAPIPAATLALVEDYRRRAADVPLLASALGGAEPAGSNVWAVSGRHTASGAPLLANDPHLALDLPSTFYPMGLREGRLDVQGESFPGAPVIAQGQNRHIAWGSTVNPSDVTDVFSERLTPDPSSPSGLAVVHEGRNQPVVPVPEVFRVNRLSGTPDDVAVVPPGGGVPAATLTLPHRDGGPLIAADPAAGTALSVQWTGYSPTRELDAFLRWMEADDLRDFREGLRYFDVGSQNWSYAGRDGHIAYLPAGEIPLREDLRAGTVAGAPPWFVRDGSGANDWAPLTRRERGQAVGYDIIPSTQMPQLVDPPAGFFVNANNDPAGVSLDNNPLNEVRPGIGLYYLNPGFDVGLRAGRITERLRDAIAAGGDLTMQDMVDIQADVVLHDADVFVPYLERALERARASAVPELRALAEDAGVVEAVGRLAAWDGSTPTGIPEGYDAADVDGVLGPVSDEEARASVAATLYQVWRGRAVTAIVDAPVAQRGLPVTDNQQTLSALRTLLERLPESGGLGASGLDFFAVPGVADVEDRRDVLLLGAMADALALLRGPAFASVFGGSADQDDYRWGRLHRLTLDHPLGPPRSRGPYAVDGGSFVVDASNHSVRGADANAFTFGNGPNRRAVAEPRRWWGMRAISSLPGGPSGDVTSPLYDNLLPQWLTNDTYPVRQFRHR